MTKLRTPDAVKMLQETLSVAQMRIGSSADSRKSEHIGRLQRLIDDCARQRPTGPDGKHGDHHTWTCGCQDNLPFFLNLWRRLCRRAGRTT